MIFRKMIDNNYFITNYALYAFISVPDYDEIEFANLKPFSQYASDIYKVDLI